MIVIVDFGMGNLKSIQKALVDLDVEVQISGNPSAIEQAERLILPGVGAYIFQIAWSAPSMMRSRGIHLPS